MAIENNICEKCIHSHLCVYKKTIEKFSDEQKNAMGVDIEIKRCTSYQEESE